MCMLDTDVYIHMCTPQYVHVYVAIPYMHIYPAHNNILPSTVSVAMKRPSPVA